MIIALVAARADATRCSAQEVLVRHPANAVAPGQLRLPTRSEIIENDFDRTLFGGASAIEIAANLDRMAAHKIEIAARDYAFTGDDRLKLKAAARGDIKRFLDLVAGERLNLLHASDLSDGALTSLAIRTSTVLRDEMEVVLDSHSLFAKTLCRVKTVYENEDRARLRTGRFRLAVDYVVTGLQKPLGLSSDQRQELTAIVMAETRPLKRYGQLDSYAVLAQMAKMPDGQINAILNDSQRRKLDEFYAPAKAQWTRLIDEQYLETELSRREEAEIRAQLRALNQMPTRVARGQP